MKLLRDPLVGFLLAGALIFALDRFTSGSTDADVIEVSDAQVRRISDQWQAQMGRPPTEQELAGLVEQWIREEIYYREALKMGLDDNDTIIRRRLAQKLTFLTEDLADAAPPDQAELLAFYDAEPEAYTEPERFSFEHRYFSSDRREDARADAEAALASGMPEGDPFMLQQSYAHRSQREIGDLFGRNFAAALAQLSPSNQWQGPIRSAYGWHLIRLTSREPKHLKPFEEVAGEVAEDLKLERRQEANESLYEALRSKYTVRMESAPE